MSNDDDVSTSTGQRGPSRWGIYDILRNLIIGVGGGTVAIVVFIVQGQPLGIVAGVGMIAIGGYYAWRGYQGRQIALGRARGETADRG